MAPSGTQSFPHAPPPRTLESRRRRRVDVRPHDDLRASGTNARPKQQVRSDAGVRGNARLTSSNAAVLIVLLAVEGATVLRVQWLLTVHVVVGLLLIGPVSLKIGSTFYRFTRYYLGDTAYRQKGPPTLLLRVLGPLVVVLTAVLFASGVVLLFAGPGLRSTMLTLHQVSFVAWFVVMTVHVLAHVREVIALAWRNFWRRSRARVSGAKWRLAAIGVSLFVGIILAAALSGHTGHFRVA